MKSERVFIIIGFCLISLIWGSTWLAIKIGLDSVPPLYGVALRFTLAAILFAGIVVIRRESIPLDRNALVLYLALGAMSFSLPFALVYWGEQYIASSLASILFGVYPFVVGVLSHFYLPTEKLTVQKTIGVVLGFLGILVIFWHDVDFGNANTLGMAAVLLSATMQGTILIIVKRLGKHITPTAMNMGGMMVGLVFIYALAVAFEDFSDVMFDGRGIGSIAYLGTFGTVVTFTAFYWLLKRVDAVYLALTSFITPIIAIMLGAVLLHESLSPRVGVGAGLVLIGILIANSQDIVAKLRRVSYVQPKIHGEQ